MRTAKKYGLLLASTLLAAAPSYASSITGISLIPDASSPFNSDLSATLTSSTEATVTGTVTCPTQVVAAAFEAQVLAQSAPCSGEVEGFSLGVDVTGPTEFTVDISGTLGNIPGDLSAGAAATGIVDITGIGDFPFNVSPGPFDVTKSILLPASVEGSTTLVGSVDLTMGQGQEITLPLTLSVAGTTSTVPEPSGQALLMVGLLGIAGVVRYRFFRTA
jgi:hypothetical protein